MKIEWDENKNRLNQKNHKLSFEVAQHVFDDPCALSVQDRHEGGEERWQTIGNIRGVVVILVAHTYQEGDASEVIRIISARKATKKERKNYEQTNN